MDVHAVVTWPPWPSAVATAIFALAIAIGLTLQTTDQEGRSR